MANDRRQDRSGSRTFAMLPGRLVAGTAALVALASLALAGCDTLFPKRSEGEKLWRERCADCHGIAGNGNTPQYMGNYNADLTDNTWIHGGEPGSWAVVIRQGVFGSMPANPDLSRQQVQALVEYLRELRGEAVRKPRG